MKRKLQLLGVLILSLFLTAPLMYAQGNMQSDTTSDAQGNMQNDETTTGMSSDTDSSDNAEEYYHYAKKNIIEDKSFDEEYQGKWVDSSKQATSDSEKNWSNENDSNESMNNMNNQKDQMNQQKKDAKNKMNEMKKDTMKSGGNDNY